MAGGIAISVGALAQGLDHGTEKLTDIKFQLVDPEWEKGELLNGAAAFTAGACSLGSLQASVLSSVCCMLTVNLAYAMVAAVMVACVELKAKGSGIPEIKGLEPLRLCFVRLHT